MRRPTEKQEQVAQTPENIIIRFSGSFRKIANNIRSGWNNVLDASRL